MTEKIKLSGGPEKTTTRVWLESGQLKVELYDFSDLAQNMFGNDIAHTITVHDMDKLYSILNINEILLIPWVKQYFKSYFDFRHWLEENRIKFHIERESWA